jgi:hypothetical protein
MPELTVSIPHQLSQDEALRRIQSAIAQAKTQYSDKVAGLREEWNGYRGTFEMSAQNLQFIGTVTVNPSDVTVQTTLPFFMSLFKTTIESRMKDEMSRILA